MNAPTEIRHNLPVLHTGGGVAAIVPQSIEEIWRVSKMVVMGGLAPAALVAKKEGDEAVSAVAIAVMAGAELGLPPMVALRSFTVISGKPALYGDGIINVVRRSKRAEYIRTGYDEKRGAGWCEAKRSDTGEVKREEFSIEDAKRAGLWDERETRRGKVWKNNQQVWDEVPNDSTWHRYPQRMLAWRAAGYCLRELFADVLGGIHDEYEARAIAHEEEPRDITPPQPPKPPVPPKPPAPPTAKADPITIDGEGLVTVDGVTISGETGEIVGDEGGTTNATSTDETDAQFTDPEAILADADAKFSKCEDEGDWEETRAEFAHLQERLFPPDWEALVTIMRGHYDRIQDAADRKVLTQHPLNGG